MCTAMKANDVKRIAVVTSIGAGDSKDQAPFFFKMLMFTVMKTIFTDKNNQEQLFSSGGPGSDLEYVIVRPGGLTVDAPTGVLNIIDGEAGELLNFDELTCVTLLLGQGIDSGTCYGKFRYTATLLLL
jgi:NAD(P)H-binding